LPSAAPATRDGIASADGKGIVVAPTWAANGGWLHEIGECEAALVSGRLQVRGFQNRTKHAPVGFVLSSHADWPALVNAVHAARPAEVFVTHGHREVLTRWLRQLGYDAMPVRSGYLGEHAEESLRSESDDASAGAPAPVPDDAATLR
jgi:putative mRNA 3-end processing factor